MNQEKDKKLKDLIKKTINKNLAGLFLRLEDLEMKVREQNKTLMKLEWEIEKIGKSMNNDGG